MPPSRSAIAFVTCQKQADLTADDQLLAAALARHGYAVVPELWDAPKAEWESYEAVIIRSPWDYFLRVPEFWAWLDSLTHRSISLFNLLETLIWNARKTYLRELEANGVPIVSTEWIDRNSTPSLSEICHRREWTDVVIKPTISGSAFGAWRAGPTISAVDEARLIAAAAERELMVQPFVPEIESDGEYSLIFFGGIYSHAILKRAKSGDYRVQADHGGTSDRIEPDTRLIAQAKRALDGAPTPCLYARVDGCRVADGFTLMELEVLEPSLFFAEAPEATERFVQALRAVLADGQ